MTRARCLTLSEDGHARRLDSDSHRCRIVVAGAGPAGFLRAVDPGPAAEHVHAFGSRRHVRFELRGQTGREDADAGHLVPWREPAGRLPAGRIRQPEYDAWSGRRRSDRVPRRVGRRSTWSSSRRVPSCRTASRFRWRPAASSGSARTARSPSSAPARRSILVPPTTSIYRAIPTGSVDARPHVSPLGMRPVTPDAASTPIL